MNIPKQKKMFRKGNKKRALLNLATTGLGLGVRDKVRLGLGLGLGLVLLSPSLRDPNNVG